MEENLTSMPVKRWAALALLTFILSAGAGGFFANNYSPGGQWRGFYRSNNREVTVNFFDTRCGVVLLCCSVFAFERLDDALFHAACPVQTQQR